MLLKDRSNLKSLANELGNAETPHPALDLFQSYNGVVCDEECRWYHMTNPLWIKYVLNGYICDFGLDERPTKSLAYYPEIFKTPLQHPYMLLAYNHLYTQSCFFFPIEHKHIITGCHSIAVYTAGLLLVQQMGEDHIPHRSHWCHRKPEQTGLFVLASAAAAPPQWRCVFAEVCICSNTRTDLIQLWEWIPFHVIK